MNNFTQWYKTWAAWVPYQKLSGYIRNKGSYLPSSLPFSRSVPFNAELTSYFSTDRRSRESIWRDPWHYALSIVYLCRRMIYQTFTRFQENAVDSINYSRDASVFAESRAERASMRGIEESAYLRNSPLWARASYVNREEYPCRYTLHKEEPMVTRAYGPVSPSMDDDVSYVCSRTITQRVELLEVQVCCQTRRTVIIAIRNYALRPESDFHHFHSEFSSIDLEAKSCADYLAWYFEFFNQFEMCRYFL